MKYVNLLNAEVQDKSAIEKAFLEVSKSELLKEPDDEQADQEEFEIP